MQNIKLIYFFQEWQQFYLLTVCLIFALAMALQYPAFQVDAHTKMLVFVGWAAYGVVPTVHWTIMMGGWQNPIVYVSIPLFATFDLCKLTLLFFSSSCQEY
jgi:hypothetical protein